MYGNVYENKTKKKIAKSMKNTKKNKKQSNKWLGFLQMPIKYITSIAKKCEFMGIYIFFVGLRPLRCHKKNIYAHKLTLFV